MRFIPWLMGLIWFVLCKKGVICIVSKNYRLTGGVFFSTLLVAKSTLNNSEILTNLGEVMIPKWSERQGQIHSAPVSDFKNCKGDGGVAFPFQNPSLQASFDTKVQNAYGTVLPRMTAFIQSSIIAVPEEPCYIGVKTLLGVVESDETIQETQKFYIDPSGRPITKAEMRHMTSFTLDSFLLGLWHYAVSVPNEVGKDTCNELFPSKGNTPRNYGGDFHTGIRDFSLHRLNLHESNVSSEDTDTDTEFESDGVTDEFETYVAEEVERLQTGNNFLFLNTGKGSNNQQIGIQVNYNVRNAKKER